MSRTTTLVDRTGDGPEAPALDALADALGGAAAVERVSHWTAADGDADRDAGDGDGGGDELLVVGSAADTVIGRLLAEAGVDADPAEGAVLRRVATGAGEALLVGGTDERGCAYACYDLAERVRANGLDALDRESVQYPANAVRGVDRFVTGPVADGWLYDEAFWEDHAERLARCRFNRFALVTGYDSAFLSPPYPFVVDVDGYDVRPAEACPVSRSETRAALRAAGRACHDRGLEFVLGVWQQRPWSANPDIDFGSADQGLLVEGLPEDGDDYADYCRAGMRALLRAVPEIDRVQLRVNFESGVGDRSTAEAFWNGMVEAVAAAREEREGEGTVGIDLRAKGLTDGMLDEALETAPDVAVPTKYWCESTGLPYHQTRMRRGELDNLDDPNRRRRYGYSDLLAEPRAFDLLYRLWVIGTNRVFLWGDPDYTRRFAASAGFGGADGFEVTAPLSLKGGHYFLQEADWDLHADPDLRHYEREDDRYWAWYRLFGRHGYDPTAETGFERELRARFGDAAEHVGTALRAASRVLPLLTAAHLTAHPALTNWAELDTGGALFADHNHNASFGETTYRSAEPSDPGLFYSVEEYVADLEADAVGGKYTPPQVAALYRDLARRTRDAADAAEAAGDPAAGGERRATLVDVRMLADLAEYHAEKTAAAVHLGLHDQGGAREHAAAARERMTAALAAWESLAERGERAYHGDLVFGLGPEVGDEGTWADRTPELEADLEALADLAGDAAADPPTDPFGGGAGGASAAARPGGSLSLPERAPADEPLSVSVRFDGAAVPEDPRLRYRRADHTEGAFRTAALEPTGDGGYRGTVPADYLDPALPLLVYATATVGEGIAVVPGLFDGDAPLPYRVVTVGRERPRPRSRPRD
jgi:hypothetical protein